MPIQEARKRHIPVALGTDVAAGRSFDLRRTMACMYDNALCAGHALSPAEIFAAATLGGGLRTAGDLRFGGIPGYGRFAGALDDVRISQIARYATQFTPSISLPAANADTLGQWAFDEGRGQTTADGSTAGNQGQLGLSVTSDDADPTWIVAER